MGEKVRAPDVARARDELRRLCGQCVVQIAGTLEDGTEHADLPMGRRNPLGRQARVYKDETVAIASAKGTQRLVSFADEAPEGYKKVPDECGLGWHLRAVKASDHTIANLVQPLMDACKVLDTKDLQVKKRLVCAARELGMGGFLLPERRGPWVAARCVVQFFLLVVGCATVAYTAWRLFVAYWLR